MRFFWQCLLGGRLGPPFFPAGKESAAGGVKKGGQGGLPNGPLDDPPTATRGPAGPLFGLSPGERGGVAFESAGGAIYNIKFYGGAKRFAVARGSQALVLRVGSSGEHVTEFLVFEAVGIVGTASEATTAKLGRCSGEQGRRSSLRKRTFVCN